MKSSLSCILMKSTPSDNFIVCDICNILEEGQLIVVDDLEEVIVDNFEDVMKSAKPRVAFQVPNTLTGDGNMSVDLSFSKMDDFSPTAIAQKVEPLRKLLEARTQLSNLLSYMDGKDAAEDLIGKMLADPALMQALSSAPKPDDTGE